MPNHQSTTSDFVFRNLSTLPGRDPGPGDDDILDGGVSESSSFSLFLEVEAREKNGGLLLSDVDGVSGGDGAREDEALVFAVPQQPRPFDPISS